MRFNIVCIMAMVASAHGLAIRTSTARPGRHNPTPLEDLDNIANGLEKIDEDLRATDRALHGLEFELDAADHDYKALQSSVRKTENSIQALKDEIMKAIEKMEKTDGLVEA